LVRTTGSKAQPETRGALRQAGPTLIYREVSKMKELKFTEEIGMFSEMAKINGTRRRTK
jgi:hypothetical protein